MRTATGPIRELLWTNGDRNLCSLGLPPGRGDYTADAPELGRNGHYGLRVRADGIVAFWQAGTSGFDSYGGPVGTWPFETREEKEVAAKAALAAVEAHFTDVVETAIARMRGLR